MRSMNTTHLLRLVTIVGLAFCLCGVQSTMAYYTDHTEQVVNSYHFEEPLFPGEEEPQNPNEEPQPSDGNINQVSNGSNLDEEPSSKPSVELPSIGPSPETGTIGSLMIWNILSVLMTAFALLIIWKPNGEKISN